MIPLGRVIYRNSTNYLKKKKKKKKRRHVNAATTTSMQFLRYLIRIDTHTLAYTRTAHLIQDSSSHARCSDISTYRRRNFISSAIPSSRKKN